jgi:hypothetical protein
VGDLVSGEEMVAARGDRLLLVYPQRHDKQTGRVSMRLKTVHPVTAQLRYVWVDVYAGVDEDRRLVTDFSLRP